jgi:hypothetical protein
MSSLDGLKLLNSFIVWCHYWGEVKVGGGTWLEEEGPWGVLEGNILPWLVPVFLFSAPGCMMGTVLIHNTSPPWWTDTSETVR